MKFVKKSKKLFIWFSKAIIAGICAVTVLSVFCMVYSYEGVHIRNVTGSTDYMWEKKQIKSNMKEGFSWLRMDTNGYNNLKNYYNEPDILLMGSSNVEALQVDANENIGSLLNKILPKYKTYNIGMSGHTIYRCMDNLNSAIQIHNPRKYVIMVTDSIELSVEEMQKVVNQEAESIPSYDSGIMYYLQKIPAVKSIYKQVSDWIFMQRGDFELQEEEPRKKIKEEEYIDVLCQFLRIASEATKEANVQMIFIYQPSQIIKKNGEIAFEHSEKKIEIFRNECLKQGIVFCDMTEMFRTLYEEKNIIAHGFNNTEIGSGHLNKYGHKVIAEIIASEIRRLEAK